MGLLERLGIRAALSPQQMTRQLSKPKEGLKSEFNLIYKQEGELGYEDYDKMMRDPQIKSGIELIRQFLLSRKLVIIPADESPEAAEVAKELDKLINNMNYPMRKVRNDIYSALVYGYSVSEIVWGMEEGDEYVSIKRIRPIPIDTLQDCFKYDEEGNVEYVIQTVDDEEIEIPAEKCLIYSYDEQFGDRYGKSILDGVYENYYHKQRILNWWNIFLQKHEGPTLAGYVENPAYKDLMREQLEDVREGRAQITAGINDRIEVLESSHRGEGFKDAIDYHDVMIFRKMNIGTMILGQQDGAGAYAQSATQMDTLSIFLDGVHEDIAAELQIKINELVDMNWNVEDYPKVAFETFEEKNLIELIGALKPLIDAMAINPQDTWFRHLLADVVSKYSDVNLDELKEEPEEQEVEEPAIVPEEAEVTPTIAETEEAPPEEQAAVIEQAATIPPKE